MKIRRTFATLAAGTILLAVAACGDGNGDGGGNGNDEPNGEEAAEEPEAGSDEDFVTDLTFGTGGTGGVYYPLGGEYSTIFEEDIDGISVTYTDSGASVENIGKIFQEEWQLGVSQSDTANAAVNGDGDF